jgi:hypothetical protein
MSSFTKEALLNFYCARLAQDLEKAEIFLDTGCIIITSKLRDEIVTELKRLTEKEDIELTDARSNKVSLLMQLLFDNFQFRHFILPGYEKDNIRRAAIKEFARKLLGEDFGFEELC